MVFILHFLRTFTWKQKVKECVGCRALRVRKKTGGEKMPVQTIGDILAAELSHMQAYIRFCSCQLNGAALLQQKTDEDTDFKDFLKVTPSWDRRQASPVLSQGWRHLGGGQRPTQDLSNQAWCPCQFPKEIHIQQRIF